MLRRTLIVALLAGTGLPLLPVSDLSWICAARAEAPAAEAAALPLKSITLYRSGVGSFWREGRVTGDTSVSLRFETDQINDILKSMVLMDLDGGRIGAVGYGSKEPLERRLASFGVNITEASSMDALFKQLRGAALRVTTPEGTFEGAILGVESRTTVIQATQGGNPGHFQEWHVNLVTQQGVRSIPTSAIRTFELADPQLNEELNRALAAVAEQRADRLKSVDLSLSGPDGKQRRVMVGYVHELPVWKTSYRLVLPDKEGDKPALQGWAIVENTTDEDWRDVRLSLASGRPVGFTMDLYEPVFVARPQLPVPVGGALSARAYETGFESSGDRAAAAPPASAMDSMARSKAAVAAQGNFTGNANLGDIPMVTSAAMQVQSAATGGEVGEQFMYTLDAPVTIERQRSAMLPIIGAPVSARRVSIYTGWAGDTHPMRGAEFVNDSGLHLLPGPIAVFDGGAYAGDSQIPHTSRGQKRLMTYALDIDVRGRREMDVASTISRVRIIDGTIRQTVLGRQKTRYTFDNNDAARGRTLIVEHERMPGWELKTPAAPSEETESTLRFELELTPSKSTTLDVVFERVYEETVVLTGYDLRMLTQFRQEGKVSQAVLDSATRAGAMSAAIRERESRIAQLESERQTVGQDQSRLRENMQAVDRASDLYSRYMRKLGEQETQIETLDQSIRTTRSELDDARAQLEDYLRKLSVE